MTHTTTGHFTDPDAFQAQIEAAVPGLHVRSPCGDRFSVDLSMAVLPRMALFSVKSLNLSVERGETCGVTIPVRGGFSAALGGKACHHAFDRHWLYLKHANRDFDYRASGTSEVLVANVLSADLQKKAATLAATPDVEPVEILSAASAAGGALTRFAHHFWDELQQAGGLWDSPTALGEMEDCFVSLLALASYSHDAGSMTRLATVRDAEDYLMQHLTRPVVRTELAVAAGASLRTVSRGFEEHHGVSPMAWLKARRLEAIRNELRVAVPGEVTVTEVALRYGFESLGRFAAEYRRRFGENPSQTLRG